MKAKAKARMHAKAKAGPTRGDTRAHASGIAVLTAMDKEWADEWVPSEGVVSAAAAAVAAAAATAAAATTAAEECDVDDDRSGDTEEEQLPEQHADLAGVEDEALTTAIKFADSFFERQNDEPSFFDDGTVDLDVF